MAHVLRRQNPFVADAMPTQEFGIAAPSALQSRDARGNPVDLGGIGQPLSGVIALGRGLAIHVGCAPHRGEPPEALEVLLERQGLHEVQGVSRERGRTTTVLIWM